MKRIFLVLTFLILNSSLLILNAQVGINTDNSSPDASAMLDIKSIDKGMLVPRLITTQRTGISSPATGLLVFDSTTGSFWYYGGAVWTELSTGSPKTIADADNDTKIQVEESADEDIIRFDVAGTEVGVMDGKTFHFTSPGNSLFIGKDAGLDDDGTDNQNVAIGFEALKNNTTGNNNLANGFQSLYSNTTGGGNNAKGTRSLFNNTTGDRNVADGSLSLISNTTGAKNTAIGYGADVTQNNLINATAIGNNAKVNSSNKIQLGDANVTAVATAGTITAAGFVGDGSGLTNIVVQDADNDTKIQVEESADEDKIRFDVAGTEVMVIDNGNVGIGDVTPTSQLVVRSDANNGTANELVLKNRELTTTGTASRLVFQGYRDSNEDHEVASIEAHHQPGDIGNTAHGGELVFKTNTGDSPYNEQGVERMRITNNGKVGIGESTLTSQMVIRSDANNETANELVLKNRELTTTGTASRLVFQGYRDSNENHEVASIEAHHQPGDIGNAVHGGELVFKTNTGDTPYNEQGVERMRITVDGNVGIATGAPTSKLSIGNTEPDGNGSPAGGITFHKTSAGGYGHAAIYSDGSTGFNGSLVFATDGDGVNNYNPTEKMRIHHDGKVEIGSGNIALTDSWISNDGDNEGIKVTNGGQVGINNTASNATFFVESGGEDILFYAQKSNGNAAFTLQENGVNSINSTQLQLNGQIVVSGLSTGASGGFTLAAHDVGGGNYEVRRQISSRRYKENIRAFEPDVDLLLQAELKSWTGKGDDSGKTGFGYIAEEIDSLGLKELVLYNEEGQVESLVFGNFHFYNMEIIKKHRKRIIALEAHNAQLTNQQFQTEQAIQDLQIDLSSVMEENEALQSKLEKLEACLSGRQGVEQRLAQIEAMLQPTNANAAASADSKK